MEHHTIINIQVKRGDQSLSLKCKKGESILEVLREHDLSISAICGGNGRCGKCKIKVLEGHVDISHQDKLLLSEEDIAQGIRLACHAYPMDDCTITIPFFEDETEFEVVSEFKENLKTRNILKEEYYIIAIDIGTTTIAMNLIGVPSRRIQKTHTRINKQRDYGADVISRICASNEGKKELLKKTIVRDLMDGIQELVEKLYLPKEGIKGIALAGNTTMIHLLMGYSCETLGVYPFTPVNLGPIEKSFKEVFSSEYLDTPVVILPGISTYVGADMTAGLLICEFEQTEKISMLIDIGTNGEMAIGNKDQIMVCSTAAGPAFEGGNISCGVGSIPGAISSVSIQATHCPVYETIKGKAPIGICGTGVIEITAELMRAGLIDETGLLDESYAKEGYRVAVGAHGKDIVFTQRDIREVQLAKSAIRSGIEILLERYGVDAGKIHKVYLSGGFGQKINVKKAMDIGLLPPKFLGKTEAIGNSSLAGAAEYLIDARAGSRTEKIIGNTKEIQLSTNKNFNEYFSEYMLFNTVKE